MSDSSIYRKESLERLSSPEQLDQLIQIVTLRSWLPLTTLAGLLGIGLLWSFWGRIPVTTSSRAVLVYADEQANELVGVAYFDAREAVQIDPGMKVLMIPDVETGDRISGEISGQVKSVAAPEVTTLASLRQAVDPEATAILEVLIELDSEQVSDDNREQPTDTTNQSALAGMPGIARIVLAEKAPISFVFPFFESQP